MIVGHGIDLQEISTVWKAYERKRSFVSKVLTLKEQKRFMELSSQKRQAEYLAGRWAAKEAFAKAMGTGIGQMSFQDIEVLNDDLGAPYIASSPFSGKSWLSISHSGSFVQASVILEEIK
ncbi:holo-ACP synthase [Streptococcus sciuri]|uniref:Holo-[acyl-carrier-protein] synthase n=1 Tax=Streptococcus sciuri TaxID=2973939 RepID=A0ABT2F7N1_9STRE|nr:holo-ACP synthase [Streptococcus sciuri]MCS4488218.1 holo-ACP synthase [Streptococcus sciuri]